MITFWLCVTLAQVSVKSLPCQIPITLECIRCVHLSDNRVRDCNNCSTKKPENCAAGAPANNRTANG